MLSVNCCRKKREHEPCLEERREYLLLARPPAEVDVWEEVVLRFEPPEKFPVTLWYKTSLAECFGHLAEPDNVLIVQGDTGLCIISSAPRAYEKLPVARLE